MPFKLLIAKKENVTKFKLTVKTKDLEHLLATLRFAGIVNDKDIEIFEDTADVAAPKL